MKVSIFLGAVGTPKVSKNRKKLMLRNGATCIVMADTVVAYIVMAYIVMAYIVMAHIVVAHIVMTYTVMALYSYGPIQLWPYIVMALCSYGPL